MSSTLQRALWHADLKYFPVCSFSATFGQGAQTPALAHSVPLYVEARSVLTATSCTVSTGSQPQQSAMTKAQSRSLSHQFQSPSVAGQAALHAAREG